jgi:Putative metallopeptidase
MDRVFSGTARLLGCALLVLVGFGPRPLLAQAAPPDAQAVQARSAEFHARIRALANALANAPLLKGLTAEERQRRVEFVAANMIFVLTHELGHAVISEMDLPVLGREEDAADDFAILTALNVVANEYSLRVLVNAARGWFLSARRDRKEGETPD